MIHKKHNPTIVVNLIRPHIFTIFHQITHGTWVNKSIYLTHLIKQAKYVFFCVKISNLNLTQFIKQVKHASPFN